MDSTGSRDMSDKLYLDANNIHFLKALIDAMPCMVSYWGRDFRCRLANKPYLEWYDWPHDTAIGVSVEDFLSDEMMRQSFPYIQAAMAGQTQQFERRRVASDGSVRHMWVSYAPNFDKHGNVVGMFTLATDVTPLREAEAELQLAASVYDNILEGILVTDADGKMVSINRSATEISGFSREECIGKTPSIFKSDRHDPEFYADMWKTVLNTGRWQGEIWNRRKNGEVYLEWLTITRVDGLPGEPVHYIGLFNDSATIQHHNERLVRLAFTDPLTSLPNRAHLHERLDKMITLAAREDRSIAVIFIDLDGFKQINDQFGHRVGDDFLKEVADRLNEIIRKTDTAARLGGDEFVIVLENPASKNDVANISRRIIASLSRPAHLHDQELHAGASLGIAVFPAHGRTPEQLLKSADTAMYAAKNAGKNTYRFYVPGMEDKSDPDVSGAPAENMTPEA